ncbi:MAG: alcohol dehydrogenase catalytic domain-containing protein [bacterium]|nr:alcohol dehydrogenase catalytic domain-containing protein [bacterium]
MPDTMRASVLYDVAKMEVRDVPRPALGPRDILIENTAVGLCGTDFHIFTGEANYNYDDNGDPIPLTRTPQVLGHEIVGRVVDKGKEVRDLGAGDRVILDQGLNCQSKNREPMCEYCATGYSHQCQFYTEFGITGLHGGLSECLAAPAVNAIRIVSDVPDHLAAMTEPLTCILHTTQSITSGSARYVLGARAAERRVRSPMILGAGPAGLLFLQVLRNVHRFQGEILVSEPNIEKRALAENLGGTVVDPGVVDLRRFVREHTRGRMIDLLIEASGSGAAFAQIPGLIRRQATVVKYGIGHTGQGLELMNEVQWKEPTFLLPVGASSGFDPDGRPTNYRTALRLIEEKKVDVEPLVTHRYRGLEAVPGAFGGDHEQEGYVKGVALVASE